MYSKKGDCTSELWAVLDKDGNILYSRGGSSTKSRLMVYSNETSAQRGLNNTWTKQVIDAEKMEIKCIYKS